MDRAAQIADLVARVKAAKGPDRSIEDEIALLLGYSRKETPMYDGEAEAADVWVDWFNPKGERVSCPDCYTESADAALDLVRLYVGGIVAITIGYEPDDPQAYPAASVHWYPRGKSEKHWHAAIETAATLPLTLCATALEAMRRQAADVSEAA